MDRILIHRLAVFARHGVLPEEAVLGQRFYLSLEARLDLRDAGTSDDIGATVSYADLAGLAHRIATERRFRLIEALAETIAQDALAAFPAIQSLTVRIDKPGAPVPLVLDGVAVEITRMRRG
ncbi:dihydroneopterin aldolase [Methylobacterium sp. 174MFSha1.1]|uniref:dihydroneopterin aldolase n=1 Tax=Methylobacterium sp. 174MFSha1.1 TaxID=1502749 RepID=UPI0008E6455A|nr:dihydroneopterin aldolase [Methylobacterium sp. 174MFSha1.1]SFU66658.1 dihydroneopterin aldolase [Methylobacterium sp. 174MFSha1.1]